MAKTLAPNVPLRTEAQLESANGLYHLVMQTDGKLVLHGPTGAYWATYIWNMPADERPMNAVLQNDANFALLAISRGMRQQPSGQLVFTSNDNNILNGDPMFKWEAL
jgi:hypothetical protein